MFSNLNDGTNFDVMDICYNVKIFAFHSSTRSGLFDQSEKLNRWKWKNSFLDTKHYKHCYHICHCIFWIFMFSFNFWILIRRIVFSFVLLLFSCFWCIWIFVSLCQYHRPECIVSIMWQRKQCQQIFFISFYFVNFILIHNVSLGYSFNIMLMVV